MKTMKQSIMSDNTMITVYPFNGALYTFYESPYIHQLDSELDTVGVEDLSRINMLSVASHPHYDQVKKSTKSQYLKGISVKND